MNDLCEKFLLNLYSVKILKNFCENNSIVINLLYNVIAKNINFIFNEFIMYLKKKCEKAFMFNIMIST